MAIDKTDALSIGNFNNVDMPPDAEVLLMPAKFIEIFKSIAHGNFLPFNIQLAIVCRQDVPEEEIWVAKAETINVTGGGEISRWKVLSVYTLKGNTYVPVMDSIKPIGAKVITMPAILSKDINKKEDKVEEITDSNNITTS